jgi:hypothetical protein
LARHYPLKIISIWLLLSSIAAHADILISKLNDVSISTANTGRDTIISERFCIASDPVGPYGLIAFGSGDNGAFTIDNGPFQIEYEVSYRDRVSSTGFVEIISGVPVGGFLTRPLRNNQRCPGNAGHLRIIIRKNSINSAAAGLYRGAIQLSVIPE